MIHYILQGHELQNDVQTMIQVFYPNLHYIRMDEVVPSGLSVISSMEKGIASAVLCRDGKKVNRFSMEYQEGLGEKEEKRLIKRTFYELLKAETGLRPQWGLLTGVRPAKIISGLLMEGNSEDDCLEYLKKDYLVMEHKAKLALTVAKAEEKILNSNKPKDISCILAFLFAPPDAYTAPLRPTPWHNIKIGWMSIWKRCFGSWSFGRIRKRPPCAKYLYRRRYANLFDRTAVTAPFAKGGNSF